MHNKTKRLSVFERIILFFAVFIFCNSAHAEDMQFFYGNKKIDTRNWYVSNGWSNGDYQSCEWREDALSANDKNLRITISDESGKIRPIACGEIRTKQLYSYGKYEARIKAAKGIGVNTAFFTYAGYPSKTVHDEIDFEFLGKEPTKVQVNYWVDGKQNPKILDLGFDSSADFHDYSFVWSPSKIKWFIDGKLVHETKDGDDMPSHPQNLFFSLWTSSKVMKDWMGEFTYEAPIDAQFSAVKYTPYNEYITKK
ncbi:MAG: family 16 glycosylhydrolase [Pseudomonadota bacterium]